MNAQFAQLVQCPADAALLPTPGPDSEAEAMRYLQKPPGVPASRPRQFCRRTYKITMRDGARQVVEAATLRRDSNGYSFLDGGMYAKTLASFAAGEVCAILMLFPTVRLERGSRRYRVNTRHGSYQFVAAHHSSGSHYCTFYDGGLDSRVVAEFPASDLLSLRSSS